MSRELVGYSILALGLLGVAGSTAAHHPPRFEQCRLVTVAGEVTRLTWGNPHVQVSIKASDGSTYDLVWLNMQQLSLAGIQRNTLGAGDAVIATGVKRANDESRPTLLSEIRRTSDGWQWSQPPQGC
jgi:hypothetical protein